MTQIVSRICAFIILGVVPILGIVAIWLDKNVTLAGHIGATAGIVFAVAFISGMTYGKWVE